MSLFTYSSFSKCQRVSKSSQILWREKSNVIPFLKEFITQENKVSKPNSKSNMFQGLFYIRKGRRDSVDSWGMLLNQDSQLTTRESNSNFHGKEIYWKENWEPTEVMETQKKQPIGRARRPGSLGATTPLTGCLAYGSLLSLNCFCSLLPLPGRWKHPVVQDYITCMCPDTKEQDRAHLSNFSS